MLNFSYYDDLGHVVFSPLLGGVSASSLKPNQITNGRGEYHTLV